jgi:ParB/RepB/Spo0J family partition protein
MTEDREQQAASSELATANGLPPEASPGHSTKGKRSNPAGSTAEQSTTNGKGRKNGKPKKEGGMKKGKAPEEKPTFAFQMIPTDKLDIVNPDREGSEEGTEAFENLRINIRKLGILQPLLVYFDEKHQKWVVADGKRRFVIAKLEGIAKVPCHVIRSKLSKGQEFLFAASGNAHRKDLTPWEWANLFDKILKVTQQDQKEVASAYGFSRSIVTDYLKLLDPKVKDELLTEDQFEALKKGKLSAKSVTRQIDRLNNPRTTPETEDEEGDGTESPITASGELSPPIETEYEYEKWPEKDTGITFIACGKEEKHPSIEKMIYAVRRWLDDLEAQQGEATKKS